MEKRLCENYPGRTGDTPCVFARGNSTSVNTSAFPSKRTFNTIPILKKNQLSLLELDKLVLKFMWKKNSKGSFEYEKNSEEVPLHCV